MENLQEQLTISSATIEEWTHRRTKKDGLKVNFTVSAPLPKLLAEQLRCGGIYENDTTRIDLSHKLKDIELIVPVPGTEDGSASFFPDVLYAFKAKRDEQQFTLEFAAHVTVRAEELHEIFKGSSETFDISVRPRQGQLFEGGTRVDVTPTSELLSRVVSELSPDQQKLADDILAGADRDFGCVACNNGIPMAEGIAGRHASGADCTRPAEHPGEAPLAQAAVMGGSHQAKRKPRADKGTVN
jgi:hypothetical protein